MHQSYNTAICVVNSEMEASKEEQIGVVNFLTAEGVGGMDIH